MVEINFQNVWKTLDDIAISALAWHLCDEEMFKGKSAEEILFRIANPEENMGGKYRSVEYPESFTRHYAGYTVTIYDFNQDSGRNSYESDLRYFQREELGPKLINHCVFEDFGYILLTGLQALVGRETN